MPRRGAGASWNVPDFRGGAVEGGGEWELVVSAIERHEGSVVRAAEALGFYDLMKKLGLNSEPG